MRSPSTPPAARRTLTAPATMLTALVLAVGLALAAVVAGVPARGEEPPPAPAREAIQVALLTYGQGQSSACFATGFLDDAARQLTTSVRRTFVPVDLGSPDLFEHPFVVFAGEKAFDLSDREVNNLRALVQRGGFVLASAGCSNPEFAASFRRALEQALPEVPLRTLSMEHPLFRSYHTIAAVQTWQVTAAPVRLEGLEWKGRLAVLFSPLGLHDTANAGGTCCCCGANEIRNARLINLNALVYALTP